MRCISERRWRTKASGGGRQLGQIEARPFVWVTVKPLICMQDYRPPGSAGPTLSHTLIYVLISPYVLSLPLSLFSSLSSSPSPFFITFPFSLRLSVFSPIFGLSSFAPQARFRASCDSSVRKPRDDEIENESCLVVMTEHFSPCSPMCTYLLWEGVKPNRDAPYVLTSQRRFPQSTPRENNPK